MVNGFGNNFCDYPNEDIYSKKGSLKFSLKSIVRLLHLPVANKVYAACVYFLNLILAQMPKYYIGGVLGNLFKLHAPMKDTIKHCNENY
jgi:hypothetical protein